MWKDSSQTKEYIKRSVAVAQTIASKDFITACNYHAQEGKIISSMNFQGKRKMNELQRNMKLLTLETNVVHCKQANCIAGFRIITLQEWYIQWN